MAIDNEVTEGVVESADAAASSDDQKSFFGRGALLGLVGGAVAALILIGAVGSVVSVFDDVFGSSTADAADDIPVEVDPLVAAGEALAQSNGCTACHSINGTSGAGPTWTGLSASVDDAYVRTAILDPNAVLAEGFGPDVMPGTYADSLSADDLDALVAYILSR